jgi:hypothetical protein
LIQLTTAIFYGQNTHKKWAFDSCHVEVVARSDDINLTSYKSAFSPAAACKNTRPQRKVSLISNNTLRLLQKSSRHISAFRTIESQACGMKNLNNILFQWVHEPWMEE